MSEFLDRMGGIAPSLDSRPRSGYAFPVSRTQRRFRIRIGAAAAGYRTGEKAVAISSLFSCRTGRTPLCGGHAPPRSTASGSSD
jgi:hypothetical protein